MRPEVLWLASSRLYRAGVPVLPKVLKSMNFFLFHCVLPYECSVSRDVHLVHRGLGTVIHPKTVIGANVRIGHGVTIAAGSQDIGDGLAVSVGDSSFIGTGAVILPRSGRGLQIGVGCFIGANALVSEDMPDGARALAGRARVELPSIKPDMDT